MDDQLTCDSYGVQKLLIVGSTDGLYRVSLDTNDYIPQRVAYNSSAAKQLQKIIDLDYDPIDSMIYWIDKEVYKIRKCKIDGTGFMVYLTYIIQQIYFL